MTPEVVFYKEPQGHAPVLEWLRQLRRTNCAAYAACAAAILMLALLGHNLRRPMADLLRDGIYELRITRASVQYRIRYSFHGENLALLDHDQLEKEPPPESGLERALRRKQAFEADPEAHTYFELET